MRNIRPHHIFCMALFRGAGYSAAFSENMAVVLHDLKRGEMFRLFEGADSICAACPHCTPAGVCAEPGSTSSRDAAALSVLSAEAGAVYTLKDLARAVLQEEHFQAVCGGCRWQREGLCSLSGLMEGMEAFSAAGE